MKRILAVMMAVLMFINLAGCGKSDGGGVELFEKKDPRKDLIVGEWYAGNEESDEPDIVFNEDGSVTSPSYEEGTNIRWEFESGNLILTDTETGKIEERSVLYVDEYELEFIDLATFGERTFFLFKEPTNERISQYSTKMVGTWYTSESVFADKSTYYNLKNTDFDSSKGIFVFNEDGTFETITGEAGTWSVNNDVLNILYTDGRRSDDLKIFSVTNNRVCLRSDFYFRNYYFYLKSAGERKDDYKDVPPIVYVGKYTGEGGNMVELSNVKEDKCDVTFSIESADGTVNTIIGKGKFSSIGYNEAILDFTPDGSDTVENMGVFVRNRGNVPCFCQWKDIVEENTTIYFWPKSVVVPEEAKRISYGYFSYSEDITDITLAEGIKSIGDEAINNCRNLESITIPASVTRIGENVFSDCDNLTIHAPAGSYAEQYAKENNIPFEAE